MTLICLTGRAWDRRAVESVAGELLEFVPRTAVGAVGEGVVWADGRGLDAVRLADRMVGRLIGRGEEVGCGVAAGMVAAYAAAIDRSGESRVVVVAAGREGEYLRDRPVSVLRPEERLRLLLEGVGLETCGELAAVSMEEVEIRFGRAAVDLWRRSRGVSVGSPFRTASTERSQSSLEFMDYVVTDPEQLAFTANTLLGGLCGTLAERGAHARRMELVLPLANGETWRKVLRPSRPTASRVVWLRLVRRLLDRLTVPDAVTGLGLEVLDTESASSIQGDLFDAGFATSSAVESALGRLLESQGPVAVRPEPMAHPLAEERTEFVHLDAEAVAEWSSAGPLSNGVQSTTSDPTPGLTLQLLREPRCIAVESMERRDHHVPVRFHDGAWKRFVTVAGPERISGGQWDQPYAREYFRGVTGEGTLVWIYRDGRDGRWFLHGWWD